MTFAADKTLLADRGNLLQLTRKHRELLERWDWYDFTVLWYEMKFTLLESGARRVLPHLMRLFFMSPVKLIKKTMWALPNRREYKKYHYHRAPDESYRQRGHAG